MIDQTAQRTMQVPGTGLIPRGRPTIDYKEFPKMMTHPAHQPGKPSEPIKHPSGFTYHGIGTPIRFPPVLVKTPDDEAYHASLGYVGQGKTDAAAFDRAVGNGQLPTVAAYVPLEYPKWVHGKLCNDLVEEQAYLLKIGLTSNELVTNANTPALDTEVKTLLDRPDLSPKETQADSPWSKPPTMDQLRMEDLEKKVDHLTFLLATALKAQPMVASEPVVVPEGPTREDIEAAHVIFDFVKPPKKAARKMPVLSPAQKNSRSEAIKAGMARKRALTEPVPEAQR